MKNCDNIMFKLNRLPDHKEETLLTEIRRVAEIIKKETITRPEFDKHALITASGLSQRFGGWQNALHKAGLGHRYCQPSYSPRNDCLAAKGLSGEQLLKKLRQVAKKLNKSSVTKAEFREHTNIAADYMRKRFGSWKAALEKAGLIQGAKGKRYSDEECFENLLKVWTHYGRPPKYLEMKMPPSTVGPKAYITRWGTWNKTLHAFVERANLDSPEEFPEATNSTTMPICNQKQKTLNTQKQLSDCDKSKIRLGLRYQVLKRDNFKCVLCGRSPATTPGLELHVDHIFPFSKGGKTKFDNLRSTCSDCNLGKGSTTEKT